MILHNIAGLLGTLLAFLSMSALGLLSILAPTTADNITERLMEWAEND